SLSFLSLPSPPPSSSVFLFSQWYAEARAGGDTSIFTFTLFVLACIATHRHRRATKTARTATRNIQLQYHRSPEEHAAAQEPLPAYTPRSDEENAVTVPGGGAAKYS
ncbi:MAG: hypothetical protein Q9177_003527, partial [Variospora cf. flavescens]